MYSAACGCLAGSWCSHHHHAQVPWTRRISPDLPVVFLDRPFLSLLLLLNRGRGSARDGCCLASPCWFREREGGELGFHVAFRSGLGSRPATTPRSSWVWLGFCFLVPWVDRPHFALSIGIRRHQAIN
jgi:hypothetical protein